MSDHYNHGQASDWRQRHAASTGQRTGSAYSDWAPRERRIPLWAYDVGIVAFAIALVRGATWFLGL